MALRRVGAGGKQQKELTEEQKQEIKEAFDLVQKAHPGVFMLSLLVVAVPVLLCVIF